MKVCLDTHIWFRDISCGFYHFNLNLAKALSRQMLPSDQLLLYGVKEGKELFDNHMSYRLKRRIDKYFLYLSESINVWHLTTQDNKIYPTSNQKIVLTIHDLNSLHEPGCTIDYQKKELARIQRSIDKADVITTISHFSKKDIVNHLDTKGKEVKVISVGLNQYDKEIVLNTYFPQKKFLFAVGLVSEKKNFHVLPCLLKNNDYELLIAGTQKSSYVLEIMREAKKWGVEERVKLLGVIDEASKQWYLKNCEAFLFPSLAEGFGSPPIEAMQYGKKCFLSSYTSLPEIGGDVAFYFDKDFDRNEMIAAFEKGMLTPADTEKIRQRATSFSWEKAAEEYWKIYHSI